MIAPAQAGTTYASTHRMWRRGPPLLVALALGAASGACFFEDEAELPERQVAVRFKVWCQVVDRGGAPVDDRLVSFGAVKLGYDGELDPASPIELAATTTSDQADHPGSALFELSYTMHARGDDQEVAALTCTVAVPGGDVHAGFEVSYAQAWMPPSVIERTLRLPLP